ncbi:interferon-inducible GTPase-domain-containing protein [Annulohypoxylon moriforme]|nr:interferon-inducible GTPase-domain-containing protein [Annulohypoxylon moriforme]
MPRSRSPRNRQRASDDFHWDPFNGWGTVFMVLGYTIGRIPAPTGLFHAAATAAATAAKVTVGVALVRVCSFIIINKVLLEWAMLDMKKDSVQSVSEIVIKSERAQEGFEESSSHVAICGPAGSGKTSLVNALRGLYNKDPGAGKVGTFEMTEKRTKYRCHRDFNSLFLHDCPGAGTLRVSASNYYHAQKLHLFDMVLIVHGERFGEIEVNIVKSCILHHQRFVIIRSKSDESIGRIVDDEDCTHASAKLNTSTHLSKLFE